MKKLIALAATVATLLPMGASAMNIVDVDGWTNTTNRIISGDLKDRVVELYTVKGTGERQPAWVISISQGLHKHCVTTLDARRVKNNTACNIIFGW